MSREARVTFWRGFSRYLNNQGSALRGTPTDRHYMNFPLGKTGFHLAAVAVTRDDDIHVPAIRAELVMDGKNSHWCVSHLRQDRDRIERDLGKVIWPVSQAQLQRLRVIEEIDFRNHGDWERAYAWLRRHLEKMRVIFRDGFMGDD